MPEVGRRAGQTVVCLFFLHVNTVDDVDDDNDDGDDGGRRDLPCPKFISLPALPAKVVHFHPNRFLRYIGRVYGMYTIILLAITEHFVAEFSLPQNFIPYSLDPNDVMFILDPGPDPDPDPPHIHFNVQAPAGIIITPKIHI